MKQSVMLAILVIFLTGISASCKKKGGDDTCSSDPKLAVTTSPANGTVEPPAPGPDFNLVVTVTSTMPSGGVTIEVKARPETSTTTFFNQTKSSTASNTDFTITGTPPATSCIVEITVTSKACNTNKVTSSYRYSRK